MEREDVRLYVKFIFYARFFKHLKFYSAKVDKLIQISLVFIVTPVIPTPMEIYKGQNGSVVTMIFPGVTHTRSEPRKHLLKLIWRGPNGEREKINLAVKLREFMYKVHSLYVTYVEYNI